MNAMKSIERDVYDIEAEGYCRRHIPNASIDDVQRLAASLRHKAYLKAIEPLLKAKADIYSATIPKIIVDLEDGAIRPEYEFSQEQLRLFDECDRLINEIADRFRRAAVRVNADNEGEG